MRFPIPVALAALALAGAARAAERPVLEVVADTVLDPAVTYGAIVIRAGGVTIDGRGALVLGAEEGDPKDFRGTGISARGVSGVTLKGLRVRGWERGLHVADAAGWTIEDCDFSDNFHDPRFGWGENGLRGGILLERVSESRLERNRANRTWDACTLVESDANTLLDNDFSHASNTCLKLWTASRNTVRGNRLSHGIRIDPGEVHARDSTCVLLESGSNDNRFTGNDCTHGGDGIFVRVLNGWVSTGNVFEDNDCSHANNNCVEAWSPRNTWIRNKANGGSYGFWLGASDQNVLLDNEACGNGRPDGPHNSPHLPGGGHAGIVFMFGPSSHTVLRGNVCRENNGAGIAAIGDQASAGKAWRAFHWVVEDNVLEGNRWGIYLEHADMLDLACNRFAGNTAGDVVEAGGVTGLVRRDPAAATPPRAVLAGPARARRGDAVRFDAGGSVAPEGGPLAFRWQIDGVPAGSDAAIAVVPERPGLARVALTVTAGGRSDLAWRDLWVVDDAAETGTEPEAGADAAAPPAGWRLDDPASRAAFAWDGDAIAGEASVLARLAPYGGGRATLVRAIDGAGLALPAGGSIVVWIRARNPNVPAWQDGNPRFVLRDRSGRTATLLPKQDLLATPPSTEAREGWLRVEAPLEGGADWTREGAALEEAAEIGIGFDSWGAPPLEIRLDGLHLAPPPAGAR
ncbi:MAG: right-handed parallel beta-helix repeat-containing protein [Planctomycetaceae bacterium]